MPDLALIVQPGPRERTIRTADGQVLDVPAGWELLPPGDAGLTRRVKAAGPSWTMQEFKGRKKFSRGIWAPAEHIAAARQTLDLERDTPAYAKRRAADAQRRDRKQGEYVEDFHGAVLTFLAFAPEHDKLAASLADAVTAHATPVGSGTVARTQRIPIEQRAESAVIAWMRHQTTGYDDMQIARIKGERREVRRQLAARSRQLLERYQRTGNDDTAACPLQQALSRKE